MFNKTFGNVTIQTKAMPKRGAFGTSCKEQFQKAAVGRKIRRGDIGFNR